MHRSRPLVAYSTTAFGSLMLSLVLPASVWAANVPKTLHNFAVNSADGSSVYSSLIRDAAGNLYGTTVDGGTHAAGTVFRLAPTASGPWKETVIHNFTGGPDGANPHSVLALDNAGNLYGTTVSGGLNPQICNGGCGVVFKLKLNSGKWTETVLHQFTGGTDGGAAYSGVVLDTAGNVYGTTVAGGAKGFGTAYELTPASGGRWREVVLYNFGGKPDVSSAYSTLVFGRDGSLYGTSYEGGTDNQGTVYQLTRQPSGAWIEQILCSFKGGSDGSVPFAGVIFDQSGNIYGATAEGGTANVGTAFELDAANGWSKTILYNFLGLFSRDGANPNGMIFDASGNLYGTTVGGGKFNPGTIFKLSPNSGGWTETVLYSFTGGNDGAYPSASLMMDAAGNLYGTTLWGGPAGDTVGGVAFEYVP